ncbi:hypothetical protein E2C01_024601 [Portunus trituberculatus]|uniref:Uncharacterized protein n=1 Tax=Portunus trituberculatus TaxID=210409 RepID=A0A5B7ED65_PORTR|nr:hypothetical protein [Portunus trituberculatus]
MGNFGTHASHTARTDSKIAWQEIFLAIASMTYTPLGNSCLCAFVSRRPTPFFDRTDLTPQLFLTHSLPFTVN